MVHREHAVLHRRKRGLGARAVAGDLRDARLELVRRPVQDARQLAHLVRAVHAAAGGEVAPRELARRFHDLAQRSGQRRGERGGEGRGGRVRDGQREQQRALEIARFLLDVAQGQGDAGHAPHRAPGPDGHRRVEHASRRRWRCDARPRPGRRTAPAAPPGDRRGCRARPARRPDSAESASTRPSRATIVTRARTSRAAASTSASSDIRAGPLRERRLHHARHQVGLRQELVARLLHRPPAEGRAADEQHDQQRGGHGEEGGDDHAAPQPRHHSPSCARR